MSGPLASLAAVFGGLSLISVGGVNALIPEIERAAIAHHWMAPAEFAALFALAQAAPGPNMLIITLIGWQIAGLAGAAIATAAFLAPTALLTYMVGHLWERFRESAWRRRIQAGLTPVTVGLVIAGALLLCRASAASVGLALLVLASAAILLTTRLHPLLVLAAGALLGTTGML